MNTTTLATNTFSFVNHSLPIHVVVFLVTTHGLALLSGTYVEWKIIQYLKSTTTPKTDIDDLILFEQLVNLICFPFILMQLIWTLFPAAFADIFSNAVVCVALEAFISVVVFHRAVGGLGIAIVRVMHLKWPRWINNLHVSKLVRCAKWTGLSITLFFTLGHFIENVVWLQPTMMNAHNYFNITTTEAELEKSEEYFDKIVILICLVFNVVEFICFIVIFMEMYKHHERHVAMCLSNRPNLARRKKKRNVITAVGHFSSWIVEVIIFGIVGYVISAHKDKLGVTHWIFMVLVPSVNYSIFPLVQTLTSQDLRDHVFSLKCACCNKSVEHATVELELKVNVMPKGTIDEI